MVNEKRLYLIDRNRLSKTTIELDDGCDIVDMERALIKRVREATAVDAVEVVHGHWEHDSIGFSDFWTCSACRKDFFFDDDPTVIHSRVNYCPNCGAKMDGGINNE